MSNFIESKYTLEKLEKLRDKNGFIDISETDVKITPESREEMGTESRLKNWVNFAGTRALLRGEVVENYSIYAELIVEEIAKQLGIETAHYDLIKIKDENGQYTYGVLSQSIVDFDKEDLITLNDLIGDEPPREDNIYDTDFVDKTRYEFVVNELRTRLQSGGYEDAEVDKIIKDINKRMIFYLSVMDTDKHPENIAFIKSKDGKIRLSPNYDSEFSLLLEQEKDMMDFLIDNVEEEADIQDPKIGVVVSKSDGGWGVMWRDTLETLIEDDEIYDYYADNIKGKINMDEILSRVEKRIKTPLPEKVKQMAKCAYECRNETMERIVEGEIKPIEDKEDKFDISTILNSLISKGRKEKIRTGEQFVIGEQMQYDIEIKDQQTYEPTKNYNDLLNQIFPNRDDD